ncbi:MAG: toll/interleukin-1 receptor domain-containing protein [Chloroflexota bacterium]|nr:toll/interleukin-1 receptor domain-containing protein [Chloroflexota bacterium]
MNVFLSWSGPKSRAVALALREWLPSVIQAVKPWMSAEDIEAGARWNAEISKQLESTTFGIICLTKANQGRPWIMFEAGALAKALQGAFVVPYLIDLEPAEVEGGPLSQFQAKRANKNETWQLLVTLNRALASPLGEEQLRRIYDKFWGDLETVFNDLPTEDTPKQVTRTPSDVLEEVLLLVRGIAQRQQREVLPRATQLSTRFEETGYANLDTILMELMDQLRQDTDLDNLMLRTPPNHRSYVLRRYIELNFPELRSVHEILDPTSEVLTGYYNYKYKANEQGRLGTSGFRSIKEIIEEAEIPEADVSDERDQ